MERSGKRNARISMDESPPTATNLIVFFPYPPKIILCAGCTTSAVDSFGTPSNIEGINSNKACETDKERRNTDNTSGEKFLRK